MSALQAMWRCGGLAVTGELIDFSDPAQHGPGVRERGVRLELRPVTDTGDGSVYSSRGLSVAPAVCRFDLLESAPGAGDRMHWHPVMTAGEPGERVFDADLAAEPVEWLRARLADPAGLLDAAGVDAAAVTGVEELRDQAETIADWAARGLRRTRAPWPDVTRDERGLAPVP